MEMRGDSRPWMSIEAVVKTFEALRDVVRQADAMRT